LTLTVSEAADSEKSPPPSGARIRLVLAPGETASLDSGEGQSARLHQGGGRTLLVNEGESGTLVKLQSIARPSPNSFVDQLK